MINVLALNSFLPLFGNTTSNQTGIWVPFELQHCGPSILVLYENEWGENQDFVVDVEIANLSDNVKLGISSSRKTGEITFLTEYFAISEIGFNSITFSSVRFSLQLDTVLNRTIEHSIAVSGQYRINNGEWQTFELKKCFPTRLTIFEDHKFEYNLTVDLKIMELTVVLELDYGFSDVGDFIDIPKDGNYSYNITAHYVSLSIDPAGDFGRAAGLYKVTTFERSPIAKMIGFKIFLVFPFLALVYVTKRKKIVQK